MHAGPVNEPTNSGTGERDLRGWHAICVGGCEMLWAICPGIPESLVVLVKWSWQSGLYLLIRTESTDWQKQALEILGSDRRMLARMRSPCRISALVLCGKSVEARFSRKAVRFCFRQNPPSIHSPTTDNKIRAASSYVLLESNSPSRVRPSAKPRLLDLLTAPYCEPVCLTYPALTER